MTDVTGEEAFADEARTWAASRRGDERAFLEIYRRHSPVIFRYIRRTFPGLVADELVADVFLQLWRQRRRIRLHESGSVLPWLYGTARNLSLTETRRLSRESRALTVLSQHVDTAAQAAPAGAALEREEERRTALTALASLSAEDREALELCVCLGIPPLQAAEILGASPSTLRSRLTRARRRLADAHAQLTNEWSHQ